MRHLILILGLWAGALIQVFAEAGGAAKAKTEPGPENGGMRLRLFAAPRQESGSPGYSVRIDSEPVFNSGFNRRLHRCAQIVFWGSGEERPSGGGGYLPALDFLRVAPDSLCRLGFFGMTAFPCGITLTDAQHWKSA